MVTIENPKPGKGSAVLESAASRMVQNGMAVVTGRCNGQMLIIRLVEDHGDGSHSRLSRVTDTEHATRRRTERSYDCIERSFVEQLPGVPVVQASKMVRQEKSSRNWSYVKAVRRDMRRNQDAKEVQEMRGGVR